MMQVDTDAPSTQIWPPKIYGAAAVVAGLLTLILPLRFLGAGSGRETGLDLGILIMLAAIGLAGWTALTFRKAGTPIHPTKPTTAFITTGPFAYSRNPMYLAMTAFLFGLAFFADSLWFFLAIPIAMIAVSRLAITPEEAYLEERFSDAYRDYRSKVRRWI
jgi:protein-S-isoprenylcysteine O-methyltransferase Ste14